MLTALDHTTTVDAASIEVAAANQPVRKSAIIAFPESVEVVFLPSGEIVAPTLLTLLGAKNTRNEIKKITIVDPATTAKLRLYAVAQMEAKPWNSMATRSKLGGVWTLWKTSRTRLNLKGLTAPEMPISSPRASSPRNG